MSYINAIPYFQSLAFKSKEFGIRFAIYYYKDINHFPNQIVLFRQSKQTQTHGKSKLKQKHGKSKQKHPPNESHLRNRKTKQENASEREKRNHVNPENHPHFWSGKIPDRKIKTSSFINVDSDRLFNVCHNTKRKLDKNIPFCHMKYRWGNTPGNFSRFSRKTASFLHASFNGCSNINQSLVQSRFFFFYENLGDAYELGIFVWNKEYIISFIGTCILHWSYGL